MSLSEIASRDGLGNRARTALVPAAGWGTRLRPLSDTLPKEMLPVGRRVVLERILDELSGAGFERVVFVVSPAKEPILKSRFGTQSEGLTVEYALQPAMRGLGDAVLCAAPNLCGESGFLVALGDAVFVEESPGALVSRLLATETPLAIAVQKVPRERLSRYGVVKPLDRAGTSEGAFAICGLVEKPAPEEAPSEFAVAARYLVPASVLEELKSVRPGKGGEIQLTDALAALLDAGTPGAAVPLLPREARHDIGSFETYYQAFAAFALADPEHGAGLRRYLEEMIR